MGIKMKFCLFVAIIFFKLIISSFGNFYFPDQIQQMYEKTTTEMIAHIDDTANISRISFQKCEEYKSLSHKTVGVVNLMFGARPTYHQTPNCDASLPLKYGGDLVKRGDMPHLAQIGLFNIKNRFRTFCTGSLISEKYVLTVAHCKNLQQIPEVARLGVKNSNVPTEGIYYNVLEFKTHPNYDEKLRNDDIALIELDQNVKFDRNVMPACIGGSDETYHNSAVTTVFGYHGNLIKHRANFYDKSICLSVFNRNLTSNEICAGEESSSWRSSCKDENDGVIQQMEKVDICIYKLIGIITCGGGKISGPNIYTSINPYLEWIENIVW